MSSSKRTENNCKIEKKKLMRKEQGSIVLFVVTSMLFFIMVSFLSFNSITNKINVQKKQIEKIKEEYNTAGELEDIYEKTEDKVIGSLKIELLKQDGTVYNTNSWTNEDLILKITYPSNLTDAEKQYTKDEETYNYSGNTIIDDNCTISATDGKGKTETVIIDKIDKVKPTVDIAPDGGNYVLASSGKTTIKAKLVAKDEGGSGINLRQYAWNNSQSINPTDWKDFKDGVEVSKEDCTAGNYYLWTKVTDNAGNEATQIKTSKVFTVNSNQSEENQIKLIPSETEWTKGPITVTVEYGENLTDNRKAGFGSADTENATEVIVTENGTVYAEATDSAGNKVTAELIIDNIDTTKPTKPVITSPNGGDWTNQDVVVTVTSTDEPSGIDHYEWYENGTWTTEGLTTTDEVGTITFTDNMDETVRFRAVDKAGNISEEATTVVKIDKTLPKVTLSPNGGNYTMPTSGNATIKTTLTAADEGGSTLNTLQYAWSTSNSTEPTSGWTAFTSGSTVSKTDISAAGTYYLWTKVTDKAGNRATSIKTSNAFNVGANTTAANQITLTPDKTAWTNGNVIVTVTYGSNLTQNRKAGFRSADTANATSVTVTGNGTVYAEATDIAGNKVTKTLDIGNIDKTLPKVTLSPNGGNYKILSGNTTVQVSTKLTAADEGGSTLNTLQYAWSTSNTTEPTSGWTTFTNGGTITTGLSGGKNYLWLKVTDKAGNRAEIKVSNAFVVNYQVIYNANGGSGAPVEQEKVHGTNLTLSSTKPTKEGHTFAGWATTVNATTAQYQSGGSYTNNSAVTLYAVWTTNQYTVTYNENYPNGSTWTETKPYNSQLGDLNTPTREGYTFVGWFTAPTGGEQISSTTTVPANDVTYYAQWTINQYYIDVNMKVDNTTYGSGYNDRIQVGIKIDGVDQGYVKDYYKKHDYGTTWEVYGVKIDGVTVSYTENGTLGAANKAICPSLYTVTFTVDDATYGNVSTSEVIVLSGATYSTSSNVLTFADGRKVTASAKEVTGYTTTFASWSSTSGTVTAKTSITARFTTTTNKYSVVYNYSENGGTSATKTSDTVSYNASIDLTPTATKGGYEFVGWNKDKNATTGLESLKMETSNVTLYAIFSKTVTATCYYYNNQNTKVSETIYNKQTTASLNLPTIASQTVNSVTYTARGWSTSNTANTQDKVSSGATVSLDQNATYYASYEANITATFNYCTLAASTYTYKDAAQASKTAVATRYMGYKGDYVQSNYSVPAEVTASTGGASAENYIGVSTSANSVSTVTPTTANTTFYAVYTETLKFYYYDGSSHISKQVTRRMLSDGSKYSNSLSQSVTPSAYDGATFVAWTYDATKYTTDYRREPLATGVNSLYAIYQKEISITYDANGGTGSPSASKGTKTYISKGGAVNTYNPTITLSTTEPTKAGYTFDGWYDAKTEGNKLGTTYEISDNKTIYAHWVDTTAPTTPVITNSSNGNWTNQDVVVTVTSTDSGSGIDHYEWYESGSWTTRALTTTDGVGTITYTAERDLTIRFRAVDKAGNISDEATTVVRIDKTLPTVSLSPNGGNYTMPTSGNATIKTTLTAADEGGSTLNTLQYAWSTSNSTEPTSGWTAFTSGSTVSKTDISAAGTYYLWTKVTDKAGNRATSIKTSNAFNVGANTTAANQITLTPDKTAWTNGNVIVTVTYGSNLTQNRKAGFRSADTANATSVTVTGNGTVYAEATDIAGNKVTKTLDIGNIDKTLPTVSLNPNGKEYSVQETSTTVSTVATVGDTGGSGLNTVQYAWSTSSTTEPTSGWTTFATGDTISATKSGGVHYLWLKVTDKAGNRATMKTSNAFTVNTAPVITKNPSNVAVKEGETATFSVTATNGYPSSTTYQWQKQVSGNWTNITGATSSSYELTTTKDMNNTSYRCVVSNGKVSANSTSATLTVYYAHTVKSISDVAVQTGSTATFDATASGGNPTSYTYKWYYTTTNSNASGTQITTSTSGATCTGVTTAKLSLASIQESWNNYYVFCEVSNGQYTVKSNVAKITVGNITGGTIKYLKPGATVTLTPTKTGGAETINWTTSNSTNAKLSATTGNSVTVTAGSTTGNYTVTATDSVTGASTTYTIKIANITVSPTSVTLDLSGTKTKRLTVNKSGETGSITYSSSNASIATVSTGGLITGVANGTATITVTEGNTGAKATCAVTVQTSPTAISLNTTEKYLGPSNTTHQLSVTYTPSTANANKTITWKTSNSSVATVSTSGLVTSVADGECTITARTQNGKTATCKIIVDKTLPVWEIKDIDTTAISLGSTERYLNESDTYQFVVTYEPTIANINKDITWATSNSAVATVSSSGLVTGVKPGESTITATSANGKTATCKVIVKKQEITATVVANNPSEYFGKEVTDYECINGAGVNAWKIFYADDNNIYLIADDYIHNDYCPPSANQTIYKNANYKLSFNLVCQDYTGSTSITDPTIQALNSSYFSNGYTSENYNMKSVAYMLDTGVWSVYAGNEAEYAIGGPTIEMLMKSYNKKYGVDYRAQASSATGYKISKDGGDNWANAYTGMLDTSDSLYVINSTTKAYAMWLASPSADSSSELMGVYSSGKFTYYSYSSTNPGFRPVVCLKSNTKLEKNEDGTYRIKGTLPSTADTSPFLPPRATVINNDLSTGLTIKDVNNNEWVWIEVPKSIYTTATSNTDYANIEKDMQRYASSYRNSNYEDRWYSADQHGFATEEEYNNYKNNMLKRVYDKGGFYIGRYEVGTQTARTSSSNELTTPIIQQDVYPYNYVTCKQAQGLANQLVTGRHTSSLMFGIQWDLVMKFIESKGGKTKDELKSDSTTWGNYKNAEFDITRGKYNTLNELAWTLGDWNPISSYTKLNDTKILLTTGATERNSVLNIYDLAGNVDEWTLEDALKYGNYSCVSHGCSFCDSGSSYPASYRFMAQDTTSGLSSGFRPALY